MAAIIIDGKKIAAEVREEVAAGVRERAENHLPIPGLAAVLVGNNPASIVHVRNKARTCEKLGINSFTYHLEASTTQQELEELILRLNDDLSVHGILVQLPLPDHLDEERILRMVDPQKDADGIHPYNVGLLSRRFDTPVFVPCTPAGVLHLIKTVTPDISGLNAVIIGRSAIVGMPMSLLLARENATVTICHSYTQELNKICRNADILVAAAGHHNLVQGDWVKPGAIVIDVGINQVVDPDDPRGYHLEGDTDFKVIKEIAGAITPVPGGVGPMTIAELMKNTLIAAELFD